MFVSEMMHALVSGITLPIYGTPSGQSLKRDCFLLKDLLGDTFTGFSV